MFNVFLYGFFIALAQANTILTSGSATASIGQESIVVVISVDASEPIAGFQADWTYPASEIEIISVEKDSSFSWFITEANPQFAPGVVRLISADMQSHQGQFDTFIIEFNVLETATPGDYTLDMVGDVVADSSGNQLSSTVVSGVLTISPPDADGDGFAEGTEDCDDTDPNVHAEAEEICDKIDNNCDGSIDEGVTNVFYLDTDGDGYGDPASTVEDCEVPEGYVNNADDCDDSDENINPASEDVPGDGIDNDCSGEDTPVEEDSGIADEAQEEETETDDEVDGNKDESTASLACSQRSGQFSEGLLLLGCVLVVIRRRA